MSGITRRMVSGLAVASVATAANAAFDPAIFGRIGQGGTGGGGWSVLELGLLAWGMASLLVGVAWAAVGWRTFTFGGGDGE